MNVEGIMNTDLLTVPPNASLREATQRMSEGNSGAALVVDTSVGNYAGIITERDVLNSIAAGHDPDTQRAADDATSNIVTVSVDESLEQAVKKMLEGDFRHLLVVHEGDAVGVISMRDLVSALSSK